MWRRSYARLAWFRPYWVLFGLIILAAILRLWRLDLLPPGLFFDEAFNGMDAQRALTGEHRPLYFAANNGREPLYIYLQALAVGILGPHPLTLRLVSALIGIASIPIIYGTAYTILQSPGKAGNTKTSHYDAARWAALIAAAGLAVSYWHLSLSRLAFRAVLLVPLSALAIAFFWRGWNGRHLRWYAWSGIWFVAALYTYTAARVLPLVVLLFALVEFIAHLWRHRNAAGSLRPSWQPRLRGLGMLALVIGVGVLPLLWTNLAAFTNRTLDVSILGASATTMPGRPGERLLANLVAVARNFYNQGDLNLRHNLPGRPVNDPLLAVLFTLGWITALWRIGQPRYRLVLTWLLVMLIPTLLSTEAPHALRSAGILPPLAILYGVGAETVLDRIRSLAARRSAMTPHVARILAAAMVVALVVISGGWTARDYFLRWADSAELGRAFDLDLQIAAETTSKLLAQASPSPVLLTSHLFATPQMGFALNSLPGQNGTEDSPAMPDLTGKTPTVLLEEGFDPHQPLIWAEGTHETLTSRRLEPLATADVALVHQMIEENKTTALTGSAFHKPGWPQVMTAPLPEEIELTPRRLHYPLSITFANGIQLAGYDVQWLGSDDGDQPTLRLILFWQFNDDLANVDGVQPQPPADPLADPFDVFAHLLNAAGMWQEQNGPIDALNLYLLREGTGIEDVRDLPVPSAMGPGKAYFEVGLSSAAPGGSGRIPVVDDRGQVVADHVNLGAVAIGAGPQHTEPSDLPVRGIRFHDNIELVDWQQAIDPANPAQLRVALTWQAVDRPITDYTAFVHLVDADEHIVSQNDQPPGGADNPTHLWLPGETVQSIIPVDLPSDRSAAELSLRVGLYEPVSGYRLPVAKVAAGEIAAPGESFVTIPLAGR